MSRAALLLLAFMLAVTGCGIRRPLIRPADVPAYEAERDKRRKELMDTGGPSPFIDEQAAAPATPATPPQLPPAAASPGATSGH